MKNIKLWLIALLFVSFTACNIEPDPTPTITSPPVPTVPSAGTADFTKYVAIGNSLTAGFADNGLYRAGQLVSYPNLLSQEFARAGGGVFIQPLFSEAEANGSGYLRLVGLPSSIPNLEPVTTNLGILRFVDTALPYTGNNNPADGDNTPVFTQFTGANNNLGVPGLSMAQIDDPGLGLENTTGFNPFFERLLADESPANLSNYLQYVTQQAAGATFFSVWLGNNDVLFTAASGGLIPSTDAATFETNLDALLDVLTAGGAKGVIANIPDVTKIAFFNTITENAILSPVNGGAPIAEWTITELYIQTGAGTRAMDAGDFLLITGQSNYANIGSTTFGTGVGPYGLSPANPITTQFVLDSDEATAVRNTIASFNALIAAEATARDLALADAFAIFNDWASTGATFAGVTYTTAFITGGINGLDGVHLTPAGNALIANEFIKVINTKYGSTFTPINVLNYSTLPNLRYP